MEFPMYNPQPGWLNSRWHLVRTGGLKTLCGKPIRDGGPGKFEPREFSDRQVCCACQSRHAKARATT